MSWHKDDDRHARRGYHHGNLREALIRAALELIGKKGPAGFTFAEAARAAGVSSAAPYRHYRDLPELMADVALLGFEKFEAGLSKAWNNGMPEPVAAFENVGKAYLAFAREEPALYAAMFESGLALDAVPALQQASDRAFAVLAGGVRGRGGANPEGRPPAGPDAEPAYVGLRPRHRLAVRPRRCRAGANCPCRPTTCWKPDS